MSWWSTLGKIGLGVAAPFTGGASLLGIPAIDAISAGGSAISGATQAAANNRGAQLEAATSAEDLNQGRQRIALARDQERAASGKNAMREALIANYIAGGGAGGGAGYTPAAGLKSYGFGPQGQSDFTRSAASAYGSEVNDRLQNRDLRGVPQVDTPFEYDPNLTRQSLWEKIGNVAGPALSAWGAIAGSGKKP